MAKIAENPEVTTVAIAALVKLIRLLGAEFVAGSHRDDIDLVEKSVRAKLYASVNGISAEATAAGVAFAHSLVEPVLQALRVQAQQFASPQQSASPQKIPQTARDGSTPTLH